MNDDRTLVQIFESYRDSAAVVDHVTKTFSRFAEAFGACVIVDGFVVYGIPDPAARRILDGFGSDYMPPSRASPQGVGHRTYGPVLASS